ncbi:MAG: hypothetical protein LUC30_05480 [Clostridiales bacterium]|nr:hypothetical protein [Clostridiales bacterium]MCD8382354.1 hypothetical protein [Clostridiales bacterium]
MARNSNPYVQSNMKKRAESIPFAEKLPEPRFPDLRDMPQQQVDAELERGYVDIVAGRTRSAKDVFAAIQEEYGI